MGSSRPSKIERYLTTNFNIFLQLEFKDRFCTYHERTQDNYVVLQSSYNQNWFVGFGRDGNSLKGADWKLKLVKNQGCYKFLKTGVKIYESMSDISHNHIPKHHPKKIQKFLDSTLESLPVLKYSTILPGTRVKRTPVPIPETIPKVSRPVLGNSGQYDEAVAVWSSLEYLICCRRLIFCDLKFDPSNQIFDWSNQPSITRQV